MLLPVVVLALLQAATRASPTPREPTGCGSNIVSATVVATFCGHREGDAEILDLLILWRGRAGWFQRTTPGVTGSRGSRTSAAGAGRDGQVSEYTTYNDVTIGYDADFDRRTAAIEHAAFPLDDVNTVLVDKVDEPSARRVSGRRRLPSRLPLAGDYNLFAIRRSPGLVAFLQCGIPMPVQRSSRGVPVQNPPVITVCEKLQK